MNVLGLIDLPFWLVFIIAVIVTFYLYTARKHSLFKRYGIPAIIPKPFIGGFPLLAKKGAMQSEYDAITTYGKCVGFFLGNMPTVFLAEPEIIREIFIKQYTRFPNHSQTIYIAQFWEKTVLLTSEYENWHFLRTTLTPAFTGAKLRKMDHIVANGAEHLVNMLNEKFESQELIVDMVPVFQGLTLDVICQAAMGVKLDSKNDAYMELKRQISGLLAFSIEKNPFLLLSFLIPDIKKIFRLFDIDYNDTKAIRYIETCLKEIIKVRKESGNPDGVLDILQLMINTQDDDKTTSTNPKDNDEEHNVMEKAHRGMTDDEIIANAIVFLFAGYETTATAMVFTSYFLATHQDWQETIWQEIKEKIGTEDPNYDNIQALNNLDMFISESMRLYPPVTRVNRQIEQDSTVGQYTFPKDISITIPVFTVHRLPEFWPEPEKFDPQRFSAENKANIQPYTYLPFGVGPRNCVGMRFAKMELKMTLVKLLKNFHLSPSPDLTIPPKLEKHVFCKPVGGMKLLLKKRV